MTPSSGMDRSVPVYTKDEVSKMSYVHPSIRPQFDALPDEIQEHVLETDIRLETMTDLAGCLERITAQTAASLAAHSRLP